MRVGTGLAARAIRRPPPGLPIRARSRLRSVPGILGCEVHKINPTRGPGFQPRWWASFTASRPEPYRARPNRVIESSSLPPSGTVAASPTKSSNTTGCAADFPDINPFQSSPDPHAYTLTTPSPAIAILAFVSTIGARSFHEIRVHRRARRAEPTEANVTDGQPTALGSHSPAAKYPSSGSPP